MMIRNRIRESSGKVLPVFFQAVMLWTLMKSALLLPLSRRVWDDGHIATLDASSRYSKLLAVTQEIIAMSHHSLALALVAIQFVSWILTQASNSSLRLLGAVAFSGSSLLFFESIAPTLDGGDNLASLFIVLMPLYAAARLPFFSKASHDGALTPAAAMDSSLILVIRFQVAIMYAFAGACKLIGHEWQNGTALFYILQSDLYSFPPAQALALNYPLVTVAATYGTIAFQIAFPTLIWVKGARVYLIAAGTLLHLSIIVAMGLFEFGLIMIVSYLIWFDDLDLKATEQSIYQMRHRMKRLLLFLIASGRKQGARI